jgi:hypothetical protein
MGQETYRSMTPFWRSARVSGCHDEPDAAETSASLAALAAFSAWRACRRTRSLYIAGPRSSAFVNRPKAERQNVRNSG